MEYKGEIKGFPEEVVAMMMKMQEWQTGKRDITVFEKDSCACDSFGGFNWDDTPDGFDVWESIILHENFDHFFKLYPRSKSTLEGNAHVSECGSGDCRVRLCIDGESDKPEIIETNFDSLFESYPRSKHQAELIEEITQQDEKDGLYDTSEQ